MIQEKIINKKCFIRKDGFLYCSKCGKPVAQDEYNMKKHAQKCQFISYDIIKAYVENEDFACSWVGKGDELVLTIYTPRLKLRPGYKDVYLGGTWIPIYQCGFNLNEKKMRETDAGFLYSNFEKLKNVECLNAEPVSSIICRYFHIPGYKDLMSFLHIYMNKGYHYHKLLSDDKAHELLEGDLFKSEELSALRPDRIKGSVRGVLHRTNENNLILRLDILLRSQVYKMLVAKDYFYTEQILDVGAILRVPMECQIDNAIIEEFHQCYPQMGIINYWENRNSYSNICIPFLSPNYDPCLELLSKAGCSTLADCYYHQKFFKENPGLVTTNIKEWIGLPPKLLKKIHNNCLMEDDFLYVLKEAYALCPEYLMGELITHSLIQFLKDNILAEMNGMRTTLYEFQSYSKVIRRRIVDYLTQCEVESIKEEGNFWYYASFIDYLNMCQAIGGNYVYGYTPENVVVAHDAAYELYIQRKNEVKETLFFKAVTAEDYRKLESHYGDDAEIFEEDEFVIMAPKSTGDMIRESAVLHHCVRTYSEQIARQTCKIFFLRKKKECLTPYVTIEVNRGAVVQVKAIRNQRADEKARTFVKKWASVKHLKISTSDM